MSTAWTPKIKKEEYQQRKASKKKNKTNLPLKEKLEQEQFLHLVELGTRAVREAVLVEEQHGFCHLWLRQLERLWASESISVWPTVLIRAEICLNHEIIKSDSDSAKSANFNSHFPLSQG